LGMEHACRSGFAIHAACGTMGSAVCRQGSLAVAMMIHVRGLPVKILTVDLLLMLSHRSPLLTCPPSSP
jgi:hypothetical protein